jgi:flagellar basal-body rod protein FlgB
MQLALALDRTDPVHITAQAGGGSAFAPDSSGRYAIRPRGNSVTHEDEMMKVASNQMDYEAVTSLYTRSLALIKLAIGRA